MRPLRFGLVWQGDGSPVEAARRAEDAGYSTLLFRDHTRIVSPIPAMAAAAAVTTRIRLGVQVVNVVFRPLGFLAQELASVDVISGGRLEVGVGAGANNGETAGLGVPFPPAAERIAQVERTLDLLPRLFGGETVTEEPGPGRLRDFRLSPLPPQGAAVPLMVGANRDRLLALAARRARTVQFLGFTSQPGGRDYRNFSDGALAERITHVRNHAGDRFGGIELSVLMQTAGTVPDPAAVVRRLGAVAAGAVSEEEALDSPYVRLGTTVDEVCDRIRETSERHGITYFTVYADRSAGFDDVVGRLAR
jgi:probable F420-dependent oxidoreductase